MGTQAPTPSSALTLGPFLVPGTAVTIEAPDAVAAEALVPAFAGLDAAPAGVEPAVVRAVGPRAGPVLTELDEVVLAACAGSHAVVHGGAATRRGLAVVVPGASGSGKSTLTAALAQVGWDLLSDELVPIDDTGWIEPYPVAPRLRSASWELLGLRPPPDVHLRWPVPLDLLGCRPSARTRLGAIVLLDRDGHPGVERISRAEALEVLCQSCFNLEAGGAAVWRRLAASATSAIAVRLGFGTPADGATRLTAWADSPGGRS